MAQNKEEEEENKPGLLAPEEGIEGIGINIDKSNIEDYLLGRLIKESEFKELLGYYNKLKVKDSNGNEKKAYELEECEGFYKTGSGESLIIKDNVTRKLYFFEKEKDEKSNITYCLRSTINRYSR